MRVVSWLPTNTVGRNSATMSRCRPSVQASSNGFCSFRLLQIAFHSSYWVTESSPDSATKAA